MTDIKELNCVKCGGPNEADKKTIINCGWCNTLQEIPLSRKHVEQTEVEAAYSQLPNGYAQALQEAMREYVLPFFTQQTELVSQYGGPLNVEKLEAKVVTGVAKNYVENTLEVLKLWFEERDWTPEHTVGYISSTLARVMLPNAPQEIREKCMYAFSETVTSDLDEQKLIG